MDNSSLHPWHGSSRVDEFLASLTFSGVNREEPNCGRAEFLCFSKKRRLESESGMAGNPCYSFSFLLYENQVFIRCLSRSEIALNLNKGSELQSHCRVFVEWVLVVMMWNIPLDVVLDVLQSHPLFALSFVRLPVCLSPRHGKQVFDS